MECRARVIVYCTQVEQHGDTQSASYVINLESRLLDTFFAVVFFSWSCSREVNTSRQSPERRRRPPVSEFTPVDLHT